VALSAVFEIKYPFAIGEKAPNFDNLLSVDGKMYSLSSFDDKEIVVLIFIANRCPTARVYTDRLKAIQNDYGDKGVQLVGVNSDNQYFFPLESLGKMTEVFNERQLNFPYLKDHDQKVAKSYGALVTLHAFALDRQRRLRYRGRIDDSRDPQKVETHDLRNAIDDLLSRRDVRVSETRPFACSIDYF
jgi:peroxiredoxin